MRTFRILVALVLAAACTSTPVAHRDYAPDPEATAHFEKGRALFASAETAAVPSEALVAALAELDAAVKRVPSPEHRFAHARTALLLDPESSAGRDELASCVEEAPREPRLLALQALFEAQDALGASSPSGVDSAAERAEKALDIAALESAREIRCFVGDQACFTAFVVQKRDMARAAAIISAAAELGSPWALMEKAKIHWLSHGPLMDHAKALALTRKAAETAFTPEEIARGLLFDLASRARRAARELGHMYVTDGVFDEAHAWLDRGLTVREDLAYRTGEPDPHAILALAERGAIEALSLDGDKTRKARGKAQLEAAAKVGFTPALVLLARLEPPAVREDLLSQAKRRGSPGAFAASGDLPGLVELANAQLSSAKPSERLVPLRLLFFARALAKGGDVRLETERAAREATEGAPETTSVAIVRQFRHIAGDLSAEELQKTMPKSAHVPRWRAETELALATRCLILSDREGARAHLRVLLDAGALFTLEDEAAWGALESWPR